MKVLESYLNILRQKQMSELTDFLNFLVSSFIGKDEYQLSQSENNGVVNYQLQVKPEKAGLIIGRQGRTIKAIRRLLQIKASQEKLHVYLQVNSPNDQDQSAQEEKTTSQGEVEQLSKSEEKVKELAELVSDSDNQ